MATNVPSGTPVAGSISPTPNTDDRKATGQPTDVLWISSQAVNDFGAGETGEEGRGGDDLPVAAAPSQDHLLPLHDAPVDPDRQPFGETDGRDSTQGHPGERDRLVGVGEGRLAAQPLADDTVDVESGRRQENAGDVAGRLTAGLHDDGVRR